MEFNETPPVPVIKRQEGQPVILGSLSILIEGKNGLRERKVLLAQNDQPEARDPFYAIDPKTGKEVELSDTRRYEAYISLGKKEEEIPGILRENVGKYHHIRIVKKRQNLRRSTPIETPTEH